MLQNAIETVLVFIKISQKLVPLYLSDECPRAMKHHNFDLGRRSLYSRGQDYLFLEAESRKPLPMLSQENGFQVKNR